MCVLLGGFPLRLVGCFGFAVLWSVLALSSFLLLVFLLLSHPLAAGAFVSLGPLFLGLRCRARFAPSGFSFLSSLRCALLLGVSALSCPRLFFVCGLSLGFLGLCVVGGSVVSQPCRFRAFLVLCLFCWVFGFFQGVAFVASPFFLVQLVQV